MISNARLYGVSPLHWEHVRLPLLTKQGIMTDGSSAYQVTVHKDDFEIVGCPRLWASVSDAGHPVTRMFCGECGS